MANSGGKGDRLGAAILPRESSVPCSRVSLDRLWSLSVLFVDCKLQISVESTSKIFRPLWLLLLASWSFPVAAACTDTNPPSILCPTNLIAYAALGQCAKAVTFVITATNRCDASPAVICDPPSGFNFPVGKTIVTCSARDASSNTASCIFTITVFPAENAPSIEWQRSFGGDSDDYLVRVQQTSDGGFVLGGTSYSSPSGNKTSAA